MSQETQIISGGFRLRVVVSGRPCVRSVDPASRPRTVGITSGLTQARCRTAKACPAY